MNNLNELQTALPEQVGIPSQAISHFIESAADKQINLHSFMLLRHGKAAAEGYFRPFSVSLLHPIFSVSKSVTSAAIGIAIGEGLLSLDDKVVDFFPEKLDGNVHPYTAMMTIKHLLSMTTAHAKSTDIQVQDWVKGFLNTSPSRRPGTSFAYDTTGTHTLCAILQKVTGMTVHEYLKPRLFEPLGMGELEWDSCPMNINAGGSGIKCTTTALAKFGQLYLQKGVWNGVQLLPKGWVELSTAKHIDNSNARMLFEPAKGYGFQFWRARNNAYAAFGMGGQLVVVVPDKELVFVCTANTLLHKDGQQLIMDSLWETIYPVLADKPLEDHPSEYEQLKQKLDTLTLLLPHGTSTAPTAQLVSGKRISLSSNYFGYEACEFTFAQDDSKLCFYKDNEAYELRFGMKAWICSEEPLLGHPAASAATWVDEQTCIIHTQLTDLLQLFILTCQFEVESLDIQIVSAGAVNLGEQEFYLLSK